MPANKPFLPPLISRWLIAINNRRRTPAEKALDEETARLPGTIDIPNLVENQPVGIMALQAEEANFLAMQTRLLGRQHPGPMKALDIGTFTGRSALAIAQAMPHGGEVITCDVNKEYTDIAKEHWRKAGFSIIKDDGKETDLAFLSSDGTPQNTVARTIKLKLGKAEETMPYLRQLENEQAGTFDLVFIDADKPGYDSYYEKALKLLRPGGLVILDNMLWSGNVARDDIHDKNADALRDLNRKIAQDDRVEAVLLGFEDGVMVAEKRDPERFTRLTARRRSTATAASL